MLKKIISGGQTGADQGRTGLRAGARHSPWRLVPQRLPRMAASRVWRALTRYSVVLPSREPATDHGSQVWPVTAELLHQLKPGAIWQAVVSEDHRFSPVFLFQRANAVAQLSEHRTRYPAPSSIVCAKLL